VIVRLEVVLKVPFSTPDAVAERELQGNYIFCRPSVLLVNRNCA